MKGLAVLALLAVCAEINAEASPYRDGDPCRDGVDDPPATPLHDVGIDAQRAACLRDELAAGVTAHALIDKPEFHGVLGGDLALGARFVLGDHLELGARARLVDHAFVQTAVTKATATRFGPLVASATLGGAISERAHAAVTALVELPYTRDDRATVHVGGQLAAIVTGALSRRVMLHGRLGAIGALAASTGGDTRRIALRAGADLAWRVRPTLSVVGGLDTEAGWTGGLGALLARGGAHVRPRAGRWRGSLGAALPLGGDNATTLILALSLARDLE